MFLGIFCTYASTMVCKDIWQNDGVRYGRKQKHHTLRHTSLRFSQLWLFTLSSGLWYQTCCSICRVEVRRLRNWLRYEAGCKKVVTETQGRGFSQWWLFRLWSSGLWQHATPIFMIQVCRLRYWLSYKADCKEGGYQDPREWVSRFQTLQAMGIVGRTCAKKCSVLLKRDVLLTTITTVCMLLAGSKTIPTLLHILLHNTDSELS
jgi:hypothetical protein